MGWGRGEGLIVRTVQAGNYCCYYYSGGYKKRAISGKLSYTFYERKSYFSFFNGL
jgi:hypothetical protein